MQDPPAVSSLSACSAPCLELTSTEQNVLSTTSQTEYLGSPQAFRTLRNAFWLFRQYTSGSPPTHDPEANVTAEALSDIIDQPVAETSPHSYLPYPNRNAFLLGEWYWNGGPQKSQKSFKNLLEIIGDPSFSPSDVQGVNWDRIDHELAEDVMEEDANWTRTSVTIQVPAQRHRNSPSLCVPTEFVVADFYHRSIVSVVRERISTPALHGGFHYEPYKLKWQPASCSTPVSVHGELYTSQAFIKAHLELQNSPPEPNCNLPRCIVALMFASDATLLTSFGDVKLWPLYLYFGNESKYNRSKPSNNLCCHIAYFQSVRSYDTSSHGIVN